jgi:hypothetical protein
MGFRSRKRRPLRIEWLESRWLLATFNVNSLLDAVDSSIGNGTCETAGSIGVCTLRAAIQESNVTVGEDVINLPAGTIQLSLQGSGEDNAASGDLDIRGAVSIAGQGTLSSIIDAGGIDRVFHVLADEVVIQRITIRNGFADDFGGGIFFDQSFQQQLDVTLRVIDSAITGNTAELSGGGIYNRGLLEIENSELTDNRTQTDNGGGIFNDSDAVAVLDSVALRGNFAETNGGGIFNAAVAELRVTDSTLSRNLAGNDGAGIYNDSQTTGANALFINSTLDNNDAGSQGGGAFNQANSLLVFVNSTVSTNQAFSGGGVFNAGGTILRSSTVAQNASANTAGASGGNLLTLGPSGDTTVEHTIIANSPFGGNCTGTSPVSNGNNLDTDGTCNLTGSGDISAQPANLGPLQDNGGSTFTHALLANSLAIEAGQATCVNESGQALTRDQRGSLRPVDADNDGTSLCDIGAFEVQGAATGSISGTKFRDPSGDGFSSDDQPRAGVRIELYRDNGDVSFDASDPLVTFQDTAADGTYAFRSLVASTYFVVESLDVGTERQSDGGNLGNPFYTIHLTSGQNSIDNDFANFEFVNISGRKFNDLNGDGDDESGTDPPISGVAIFIDRNFNNVFDSTDESFLTLSDGRYDFFDRSPGTYRIREIVPPNSVQTTTPPADFTLQSGDDRTQVDFGNFRLIEISGRKFDDLNGDGDDEGGSDPGITGVTIFLDRDNDGVFDAGEPSTTTSIGGFFSFQNLGPGTYRVREVVPANSRQTTAPPADIVAASGTNVRNILIGNFTLSQINGRKFSDRNQDGDDEGGSDPGVAGVTIFLDSDVDGVLDATEQRTTTAADGSYRFDGLGPGTYHVREVTPANSVQTTLDPAPIVLTSGSRAFNVNFGNFELAEIQGQKFEDLNANGQHDPGEPGLNGWTIQLVDRSTNQVVASQVTADVDLDQNGDIDPETEQGRFSFAGVTLGDYDVREVQQDGWEQTAPRSRFGVNVALPATVAATGSQTVDLDSDGDFDLIVVNDVNGEIIAFLNDGVGNFAPPIQLAIAVRPQAIEVGDLNGDDAPDMVVVGVGRQGNQSPNANALVVLMNNGSGAFAPPRFVRAGDGPIAIAVGDLNRDGTADVAVANFRSSTISIFHSDQAGNLNLAGTLPVATEPVALALGDLDGDNDLDLAAASFQADLVTTWLNRGNGSFEAGTELAAGDGPAAIELSDLDGDSRADLIVSSHFSNDVSVYFRAQNSFGNPILLDLPVNARPKAVATVDVNGDGRADLVTANSGINSVSVLFYDGASVFSSAFQYPAGVGPESVSFGDWDRDGDQDLAVANYAGSSLSILTNAPATFHIIVDTAGQVSQDLDFGNTRSLAIDDLGDGAGEFPFTNEQNPVDVSADGIVAPLDALLVINALIAGGSRSLHPGEGEGISHAKKAASDIQFIDASRDNWLSPLDALLVINWLNAAKRPEGEGVVDPWFGRGHGTTVVNEQGSINLVDLSIRPLDPCAIGEWRLTASAAKKECNSNSQSGEEFDFEHHHIDDQLLESLAEEIAKQQR